MFHELCDWWNAGTRKLKKNAGHLSGLANDQVISFGEKLQRRQPDSKPEESLIPGQEMSAFVCSIVDAFPVSDIELKQIIKPRKKTKCENRLNNAVQKAGQINTGFQAVLSHIGMTEEELQ